MILDFGVAARLDKPGDSPGMMPGSGGWFNSAPTMAPPSEV